MANTDNKNNKKFSLRKLIYNDKYLIVFSIITAVIVWISTSMSLSPETKNYDIDGYLEDIVIA